MEIERKYLIDINKVPYNLNEIKKHNIEQGYLSREPVVRVRKEDEDYYLTYKSKGMMVREEYNLPLTKESYAHLIKKADGIIITKIRYIIPYEKYVIELDEFMGKYKGLYLAEVEFENEKEAEEFNPPIWFGEDVTFKSEYHNSNMSK